MHIREPLDVSPYVIEEAEVLRRVEDSPEGPRNKMVAVGARIKEARDRFGVERCCRVLDCRLSGDCGELEEVIGRDRLPHNLQEVGNRARSSHSVEGRVERQVVEDAVDPEEEAMLGPHEAAADTAGRAQAHPRGHRGAHDGRRRCPSAEHGGRKGKVFPCRATAVNVFVMKKLDNRFFHISGDGYYSLTRPGRLR